MLEALGGRRGKARSRMQIPILAVVHLYRPRKVPFCLLHAGFQKSIFSTLYKRLLQ